MSLDQLTELVKQQTFTRDAFLGGRVTIAQPLGGFRAGLDSVLLGASVNSTTSTILDLGSGVGTAALVALCHSGPEATAVLVERDPDMAALARHNLVENGLAPRARVHELDLTAPGRQRFEAGLSPDAFSSVIANPPFFDPDGGTAPTAARRGARHMPPETLDLWVRSAAAHAAPGGEVIFIHVAAALPVLLPAFTQRFGAVTVLPLLPRAGEAASRVLVRGLKGSRAPFSLVAARVLHEPEGRAFRPEFDALFRGAGRLDW